MAAVALLACGDDPTGAGGVPSRLAIEPGQTQTLTAFGQTVQLVAVAHDAHDRVVADIDVSWESRDAAAAAVDPTGLVTALGDGATYVVARTGDLADSVRVVVARPVEPFVVELVSGDGQSGQAGHELAEPLVVRVRNALGAPVPGLAVLWSVPVDAGLIDGRVMHRCYGPVPLSVLTDADGIAQVSFTPTAAGPMEVKAHIAGSAGLPVTFSSDATPLSLTPVSGTRREGKAGESIAALAAGGTLKALATDDAGSPVTAVPVTWRLTAGQGRLVAIYDDCEFDGAPHAAMRTAPEGHGFDEPSGTYDLHGLSVVNFTPMAVGPHQIVATIGGPDAPLSTPLLVFEIDVTALLISLVPHYFTGDTRFFAPDAASNTIAPLGSVAVPVGTAIEWINYLPTAHITSVTTPPGGAAFDSGVLGEGDGFQFVPGVAGAWEFVDAVSGATGTLIAE
jgi:hypothetical protein